MSTWRLSEMAPDKRRGDTLFGTISDGRRSVVVRISTDEGELEPLMALAREVAHGFEVIEPKARLAATAKMLTKYNEDWRHSTRSDGKGGFRDLSESELTADAFAQRLKLISIDVDAGDLLSFAYDPDDMFWGHGIVVKSFDGVAFNEVHVELVG